MNEKVKLKDLLVVIKDNNVKFGILNKDLTKFRFLTDKVTCNVKDGIKNVTLGENPADMEEVHACEIINEPNPEHPIMFVGETTDPFTGRPILDKDDPDAYMTTFAYPLISDSKTTDPFTGRPMTYDFQQVYQIFHHYFGKQGLVDRERKIENILYDVLGIDKNIYVFENNNRNNIVDVDYITKLEQAIAKTASTDSKKDKEANDRTRDF